MGASVRPVQTPDDAEFTAWRAKQTAAPAQTHDDAEYQQWLRSRLAPRQIIAPPRFASDATATAPDQANRRAAMAAAPPILSSGLPRELEQGATLGFGDEINAGARALV